MSLAEGETEVLAAQRHRLKALLLSGERRVHRAQKEREMAVDWSCRRPETDCRMEEQARRMERLVHEASEADPSRMTDVHRERCAKLRNLEVWVERRDRACEARWQERRQRAEASRLEEWQRLEEMHARQPPSRAAEGLRAAQARWTEQAARVQDYASLSRTRDTRERT